MNKQECWRKIGLMSAAGNFFEADFPKKIYRDLLWTAAELETEDWEEKCLLQDMSIAWSDSELYAWRERMDDPE